MKKAALFIILASFALVACNGGNKGEAKKETTPEPVKTTPEPVKPAKVDPPKTKAAKGPLIEPGIWNSVKEVEDACAAHLANAQKIRTSILAAGTKRTTAETLKLFNTLFMEVDRVLPLGELIGAVHPEKKVRTAAEKCEQRAKKFVTEVSLDPGLFKVLNALDPKGLDTKATRFMKHLIRDYRRAGIDKDEATRTKLKELKAKMTKLGQTFSRNIKEDQRSIDVTKKELKGLPADYIKRHKPLKNGKIKITTAYPDLFPFLSYAVSEKMRKKLYQVYLSRAYPKNEKVLLDLLKARHEYAKLLGYSDWAAYNAADKMVKNKKVIDNFINKVADLTRKRMKRDIKEILKRKRKDSRRAKVVGVWDRFYYVKKIKAEKFKVDPMEVRAYFDYPSVKKGILDLAQELFSVKFEKATGAKVWHKQVDAYNVVRNGKTIARFYLDMHPREGKYGHAAEFTVISGVKGVQLPSAALVCNFPDPTKTNGGPALMEHGQVTTFMHEFGHLMHQLLAGDQEWVTQSGITCEWDFVEAPSQLLEEWAWDANILARFAKHHKTGKAIPAELVAKMRKANEFGKGVHVMRQMFYAWLSYYLHSKDPSKFKLLKELKSVTKKMSPYPYMKGTHTYANFGHINGYSSMYYTYMWSLVMAKDLFTRFKKEGLLNKKVTGDYVKSILLPGGSEDAAAMVKNFLGRDYSFKAFQAYLEK